MPLDRTLLVAALRDATPAQLRKDADVAAQLALVGEYPAEDATLRRLAALALAVAEWHEWASEYGNDLIPSLADSLLEAK